MIFPGMPDGSEPFDPDLPDGTVAISTRSWFDLILRMSVHPSLVATAAALARHASPDGTRVYPGAAKVANMAGFSDPRARDWTKYLVSKKLLTVKKRGGGRPSADGRKPPSTVYRLTRPADITTLKLRLDPSFDPIADGAGFEPLDDAELRSPVNGESTAGTGKHRSPTSGENRPGPAEHRSPTSGDEVRADTELRSPTSGETGPDAPELRSPTSADSPETPLATDTNPPYLRSSTSGDRPVDNPAGTETPLVSNGNSARFEGKLRSPMSRDLDSTYTHNQTPLCPPQATDSLAPGPELDPAAGTALPPSLLAAAALDGDGTAAGHVDASAEILAARAALAASGDAARWRAAARKALAARGRNNPADHLVTLVAGELYRRALTTPAHHHPNTVIMNGAS